MKKFLVFGAVSILTINCALATEIRPFIGLDIAVSGVSWQDKVDQVNKNAGIELPDGFYGLGLDAGVRFANKNMYNAGLSLAYDYSFDADAKLNYFAQQYVTSLKTSFSAASIIFDNYIRVSSSEKRKDIVLGLGLARTEEKGELKTTALGKLNGLSDETEKYHETIVVFKLGYNQQLENNLDWYINTRWFFPHNASDMEAVLNLNTGIRYVF